MAWLVRAYLAGTGCATMVLLAAPWLVAIGLVALIVPGLVMMAVPTAFLWGAAVGVPYLLLAERLGSGGAVAASLAVAVVVLGLSTVPSQLSAARAVAAAERPDVLPDGGFALQGHVRLDLRGGAAYEQDPAMRGPGEARPFRCDALCLAVLAQPGVASVTVNQVASDGGLSRSARTYRRVDRAALGEQVTVQPLLDHRSDALGEGRAAQEARKADLLALLHEQALVMEAARTEHDLRVEEVREGHAAGRDVRWSFGSSGLARRRFAIVDADGVDRVRVERVAASALVPPLHIRFEASGFESLWWQWGRWTYGDVGRDEPRLEAVHALRGFGLIEVPTGGPPVDVREVLQAALDDPGRPASDAAFAAFAPFVASLPRGAVAADDVALVRRALADRRVHDLYKASLARTFPDPSPFRATIVDRLSVGTAAERDDLRTLDRLLDRMPEGAFQTLTDAEEALLETAEGRTRAPSLVARLADQGAAATPRLEAVLEAHLPHTIRQEGQSKQDFRAAFDAHEPVVVAARVALCRLGPEAASLRERVEGWSTDGSVPTGLLRGVPWHVMRVRLGTPVEQVVTDAVADDVEATRKRVARELQRIEQGGACGG